MTDIRPIQKSQTIDISIDATYTYLLTISDLYLRAFRCLRFTILPGLCTIILVLRNLKSYRLIDITIRIPRDR